MWKVVESVEREENVQNNVGVVNEKLGEEFVESWTWLSLRKVLNRHADYYTQLQVLGSLHIHAL